MFRFNYRWNFFYCRISATHLSAAKRLSVGVNKNIFFISNPNIFLDLRYVSARCDRHQKFHFRPKDTSINLKALCVYYSGRHKKSCTIKTIWLTLLWLPVLCFMTSKTYWLLIRTPMSFDRKSIGQTSFSQHILVIIVGQNVGTNNITMNWGDGS